MAFTVPLNIPIPASPAIASYNSLDIAEGTGRIAFNLASYRNDGATAYYLTTDTPYSAYVVASGAQVAGSSTTRIFNLDFDITFNRTQNLKGYAYLNLSIGGTSSVGTGTPSIFISGGSLQNATQGTTLTSIGKLDNQALDLSVPSVGTHSKTINLRLDLTGGPYTIAPNETLRLNLQLWGNTTGTSGISHGGIGVDPQDRNDPDGDTIEDTVTTKAILNLPVLNNQ